MARHPADASGGICGIGEQYARNGGHRGGIENRRLFVMRGSARWPMRFELPCSMRGLFNYKQKESKFNHRNLIPGNDTDVRCLRSTRTNNLAGGKISSSLSGRHGPGATQPKYDSATCYRHFWTFLL
ncbi:hypothetical protein ACN38_g6541 [Penicillium nordicum]|uniref:Uncharacterized protein n=1 Tax=Penicillium nordicum TaxID=229535 RepID=A0A0M8P7Z4_9EURO|nr:hypothetical protein ACN38_g6541 [Penicillium nordicum]